MKMTQKYEDALAHIRTMEDGIHALLKDLACDVRELGDYSRTLARQAAEKEIDK